MLGFVIAALSSAVAGASADPPKHEWIKTPSAGALVDAYPEKAQRFDLPGRALLSCKVAPDGSLSACVVVRESPADFGFGAATLSVSRGFRLKGEVGETVVVPLLWGIDGEQAPPFTDVPGDPAYVLTPASPGPHEVSAPCPTAATPARRCKPHMITWAARPDATTSHALVADAGDGTNVSVAVCDLAKDNSLTDCVLDPATTRAQSAALETLFASLRAPALANDKTPSAGNQILLQVDWAVLRAYAADKRHTHASDLVSASGKGSSR